MSLHEKARQLIDQAEVAIKANNQQYAIELLRQSIAYNGKDGDAYLLLGIALAQSKMSADAETAFIRATQLAPESVKARYNLAVHQYTEGQLQKALENSRMATQLDVRHAGAQDLVARIEKELGLASGETPTVTPAGNPVPVQMRPGYEEQFVETMPFVERLGSAWLVIGWVIAALSLAGFIVMLIQVVPAAKSAKTPDALISGLSGGPLFETLRFLFYGTVLAGIVWTIMDAINRRGNLLWVLPQIACGCLGFTWVILPVYIFVGRKN